MSAPRFPDWEARLAAYLEPLRLRPFAWGERDCCLFCAGAVEAMTGVDPMPEFRGRYKTATGAVRALRRHGAGTLDATLDTKFTPIPASLARRGDIVMSGGLLGVCMGHHLVAVGQEGKREGLVRIERHVWDAPLAWRIG